MRSLFILLPALSAPAYADQDKNLGKVYSEHSAQAVEQINKATELLQDPTLMLEKFRQSFQRSAPSKVSSAGKTPLPQSDNGAINDPTQINGSFSAALKRLSIRRSGSGATDHKLPEISLAGKTFNQGGQHSSAILNINQQLYFVKPGENFSFMQDNEIYEIAVESIDIHSVRIRIFPLNEMLILR